MSVWIYPDQQKLVGPTSRVNPYVVVDVALLAENERNCGVNYVFLGNFFKSIAIT